MCLRYVSSTAVLFLVLFTFPILANADAPAEIDVPEIKALGNFAEVPDPTDSKFRMNCKVFSTFPGLGTFVGSGTLIGPKHLITAGHLVHTNGVWASDVEVVPAYNDGARPYGSAHNALSYSWPGWVNDGDFNQNLGFVVLDRPLGAIVGHHLYQTNDSNSFFTNTLFNNAGYPAGTGYDGGNMYLWYGKPDAAETFVVTTNSLSSQGMGGAGLYTSIGNVRTVYGVLSHTIGSDTTAFVKITAAKKVNIDGIIDDNYSNTLDLWASDMQANVTSPQGGDDLSGMSFLLFNDSKATFNGVVGGTVYISTDNTINAEDVSLGAFQDTIVGLGSGTGVRVSLPDYTLPDDLPANTYYLGVKASFDDSDASNDATSGDDAYPIDLQLNYHTADTDTNGVISLSELLRVIQLFTLGEFHCDALGEDGYAPGVGAHTCEHHDSDYKVEDWKISFGELLRLVQLHNNGFYHACSDLSEEGFCTTLPLP